jgi:hypothetical protein
VTQATYLFPIDGSSGSNSDDDDRSVTSSTTYSWAPTPVFNERARPPLVSPMLSIMEGQSVTPISANSETPLSVKCGGFRACKRVSLSSTSSSHTPSVSSDIEEKKMLLTPSSGPYHQGVQMPITDAAFALVAMMKNENLCYGTAKNDDDDDNIISSRLTKTTVFSKPSQKAVPKKAKKTFNRPPSSTGATSASCPSVSFKRIPRRFIDDPTLPTLKRGMRLAMPNDRQELNSLHCFVRSELLEVFVLDVDQLPTERTTQASGHRVGIRCIHCGKLPKSERAGTSMSTFFPKSLQDIYRGVCTWQRIHFKACRHMPEELKDMYWQFKDTDRSRGKKKHWVKSAYAMGFRNVDNDRSGVVYDPPAIADNEMKSPIEDSQYHINPFDPIFPEVDEDDEDDEEDNSDDDIDSMSDCEPSMVVDSFDDARYRYQEEDSVNVEEVEI